MIFILKIKLVLVISIPDSMVLLNLTQTREVENDPALWIHPTR